LVWGVASSIIWALQVKGGAGVGAWVTFAVSAVCVFIFFFVPEVWRKKHYFFRRCVLFLALFSLFLWLAVKQPVLSVILAVLADILGFGPTIRKSWNKPQSETLFTWWVAAFRHGFGILALQKFNLLTLLYPVAWTLANVIFCLTLLLGANRLNFCLHRFERIF